MQLNELTGSCEKNHLKENKCELTLYKMNVQELNNTFGNVEGLLKSLVKIIYFIFSFNFRNVLSAFPIVCHSARCLIGIQ